jgi:dihydroorotase-like cyclic amidohydrolase
MNYVLIRNGSVVSSEETRIADILIGNNKIIDIAEKISRPDPDTPVIDASGKYVLPGAIDASRTFSEFWPMHQDEMVKLCRAEVIGGTTCMIENLEPHKNINCIDGVHMARKRSENSLIDYGFHVSLTGWSEFTEKELAYCFAHEGITSFYLEGSFNIDTIGNFMNMVKSKGLLLLIEISHPEYKGSGYTGMSKMYEQSVNEHLNQLKQILDKITETKCEACFLNISFEEEVDLIIEAQKEHTIYAELTLPCYIGEGMDFVVDDRTVMHGFALSEGLNLIPYSRFWQLLKDKQFLVSRPTLRVSNNDDGNDNIVFNRPDEDFVLKNALSVVFTSGVARKNIGINQFCDIISEKPAKLMSLYPQKGVIRQGSDADIIIWDPNVERNLYCSYASSAGEIITTTKLLGKAQFVFVKGVMAYDGEAFYNDKLNGQFVYRIRG